MERVGFYKTLHGTPPPSDTPRCVVCADISSGIHYGVHSCEGCKGFFRRCMVKGMNQQCTNAETCEITRFARNSCQFCRLKKCIRMGMSRSASKVGRRPKTTAVCATEVKVASETPSNRKVSKLTGHRRSQSLILSQAPVLTSGNASEPSTSRLPSSPYQSASSSPVIQRHSASAFDGMRNDMETMRTSVSPYSASGPSSSNCQQMWRPTSSVNGMLGYMVQPPSPGSYSYDEPGIEPSTIPDSRQVWDQQQQMWQPSIGSSSSNEPLYLGTRPQSFMGNGTWSMPDTEQHGHPTFFKSSDIHGNGQRQF